jgi:hypothetical protein
VGLIDEKTRGRKSRATVPLNRFCLTYLKIDLEKILPMASDQARLWYDLRHKYGETWHKVHTGTSNVVISQ